MTASREGEWTKNYQRLTNRSKNIRQVTFARGTGRKKMRARRGRHLCPMDSQILSGRHDYEHFRIDSSLHRECFR